MAGGRHGLAGHGDAAEGIGSGADVAELGCVAGRCAGAAVQEGTVSSVELAGVAGFQHAGNSAILAATFSIRCSWRWN